MQQPEKTQSSTLTVGAFVSMASHAVLFYLLIFGLPQWRMEAEGPEAIQVQLVEADFGTHGSEDAGGAEEPLEGSEEENSIAEAEEQNAVEEPRNAEQQQPVSQDEPEVAQEEQPQGPEDAEVETAGEVEIPLPTLRPVYQFGEETAGPEQSLSGEELSEPDVAEGQASETPEDEPVAPETAIDPLSAPGGDAIALPLAEETQDEPLETAASSLSLHDNDSQVATTAMEDTTRQHRAAILCASVLQRELLASPWPPEIIPRYPRHPLKDGIVLEDAKAAFKSRAQWFDLEFRCEIDQGATKVVAFEYEVGDPIPREEWSARKIPES